MHTDKNIKKRKGAVAVALAVGLLASACGVEKEQEEALPASAVVVDVSGSAQATDLVQLAQHAIAGSLQRMPFGQALHIIGFTSMPGAECDPVHIELRPQPNPEMERQLRQDILEQFPAVFAGYVDCLTTAGTGNPGSGSGIFGALSSAMRAYGTVIAYSDGCTFGRDEGISTCQPDRLVEDTFPGQVVSSLPGALTPDLSGKTLTLSGLGRGTDLSEAALTGLKNVYAAYADTTNATITIV